MLVEILLTVIGTIVFFAFFFNATSQRKKPIKDSRNIATDLHCAGTIKPFKIFMPPQNFCSNMKAAAQKHRQEVAAFWKAERSIVQRVWPLTNHSRRSDLISTLLKELKSNIEMYSESDELLIALCPELSLQQLLPSSGQDIKSDGRDPNFAAIDDYFKIISEGQRLEDSCDRLIALRAEEIGGDFDPNVKKKFDSTLVPDLENFLRVLRTICLVLYGKQFLLRYKSEGKKPIWRRLWDRAGPGLLMGLLAVVVTFLLDQSGILEWVLMSYKSPFGQLL